MLNKIQGHRSLVELGSPGGPRRALFRLGEVFVGQVLECHSTTEVTLAAKGLRFRAHSTLPLVPGQRYEFFVQEHQAQLILRVLNPGTSEPSQLIRLWGLYAASRASFAKLLQNLVSVAATSAAGRQVELASQRLRGLLPGLICGGSESLNVRWLTQQLSSLGLFWESKVTRWLARQGTGRASQLVAADLKGTLLGLMEMLGQPDIGGLNPGLKAMVAQTLEFVELQQQLNLLHGPESGQWLWFIPGAEEQGLHSVEVFVEEWGEESGGLERGGTIRLRVRIELSRLGPIEASVSLQRERISCQFRVSEQSLASWISSKLPELSAALEGRGFRVAFLGCEAGSILDLPANFLAQKGQGSTLLYVVV